MKPRVPDTHAEAASLLPWLANGRIAPEEREWVEAHVQSCAQCRAELAAQRVVAAQMNRDGAASPAEAASDEQRSFNKLWARIEASESASNAATGTMGAAVPVKRSSPTVRWLAAAVIVQAIGLGIFGMNSLGHGNRAPDAFTTVTRVETRVSSPAVRLVFQPEASVATVNTLLTHQGLVIVGGPGISGNFTAELTADAVASGATAESVAAVLSKDPNVSFAQPVAN
jgi:Putative zinc-finger